MKTIKNVFEGLRNKLLADRLSMVHTLDAAFVESRKNTSLAGLPKRNI